MIDGRIDIAIPFFPVIPDAAERRAGISEYRPSMGLKGGFILGIPAQGRDDSLGLGLAQA